jgi:hypothetical protein
MSELSTQSNNSVNLFEKYKEWKSKDSTTTDTKMLSADQKRMVETALNAQFLNPKYKMKHFVTSGQLTPYSTVRQWLLELKSIEENCENFETLLRKHELEKEICELRLERETDPLERAKIKLDLNKINHDFYQNKRRAGQHYIEREQYLELINEYLEGPNGKTPDGRSWMEVFGNTDEENYWEAHYWTVRLARQCAMDYASYGRVGAGNLDAMLQMPEPQQRESMALMHEITLRLESLSSAIRMDVHNKLLATDQQYAALMQGKRIEDLDKIEFHINNLVPIAESVGQLGESNSTVIDNEAPNKASGDLLDVYNT